MKKLIYLFVVGLFVCFLGIAMRNNWDVITGVSHGFLDGIREMRGIKIKPFDTADLDKAKSTLASITNDTTALPSQISDAFKKVEEEKEKAKRRASAEAYGHIPGAVGAGLFKIAREKFHVYLLIALLGVIFAFVYAKALSIRSRNRGHEKAK